ncbi:MAG: hypothetical protein WA634_00705 [Silvibacterium sp.]
MSKVVALHHQRAGARASGRRQPTPFITEHNTAAGLRFVDHVDYDAIQYEFYIPHAIWNHRSVRSFIRDVNSISQGSTEFPKVKGEWMGTTENTHIFRKIFEASQLGAEQFRKAIRKELGRLMVALSQSKRSKQDTFMFTESLIHVMLSRNVRSQK